MHLEDDTSVINRKLLRHLGRQPSYAMYNTKTYREEYERADSDSDDGEIDDRDIGYSDLDRMIRRIERKEKR